MTGGKLLEILARIPKIAPFPARAEKSPGMLKRF